MKSQIIYGFGTLGIISGILYITYKKLRKPQLQVPTKWNGVGKLKSLHMYVLNSGQRYEIREAICTKSGLMKKIDGVEWRDRSFFIYDPKSMEFKLSENYPVILTINIRPLPSKKFGLSTPDLEEIEIDLPELNLETKLDFPNKNCWDCGDEAANFVSIVILKKSSGLRLCYYDYPTSTKPSYHLINKTSVEALNKQLENPVSEYYFRPNLFVYGHHIKPWEEESWEWVKIGAAVFRNLKTCKVCKEITEESRKTKEKVDLLKLNKKKHCCNGCPEVGIFLETYIEGIIHVHDQVFVG